MEFLLFVEGWWWKGEIFDVLFFEIDCFRGEKLFVEIIV